MLFFKKKTHTSSASYDSSRMRPVLRCSICTGEQVAGFQRIENGSFEEVMLIRGAADLQEFRERYGITGDIEKIY